MKKALKNIGSWALMLLLVVMVSMASAVYQGDLLNLVRGVFPQMTIGNGATVDTGITFDGNAEDFYIGIDDSDDDFVIGLGSTMGTTEFVTVSDYGSSNATVKITGGIKDVEVITTGGANVLTAKECGKTIVDKDATPASTHTLPANAAAGCWFKFVNGIDQTANDTVTAATAATIDGIINVNDTLTPCADEDVITVVNTADVVGDWFIVESDGTRWHVIGMTTGVAALTCTT